ncbi:hypothetical protein B0T11DRAFT_111982 [Plectosphaerella cucumerina]|uniref:Cx9C motif-containing protein 4, mitochondrial n=1 Tax=Plectosphaerella cucumerina TaxID=40658 RepID=A0A8K0TCH4_9PEZI|nr:hypothetical protein B0T11DRAFT_111982 [Plectosphaerella cucumerina]
MYRLWKTTCAMNLPTLPTTLSATPAKFSECLCVSTQGTLSLHHHDDFTPRRNSQPGMPSTCCLTKNGYNEAKCQSTVLALYKCCEDFYRQQGDDARSPSCPKPDLLKLKLSRLDGQDGSQ